MRKNLRISSPAVPSFHAFANSSLNFSALLLISFPFSPRHRSIVCRISMPTASRVPSGVSPFLCMGLRPSPLLTWKSSKATLRFSVTCAAAAGWSVAIGQQILRKKVNYLDGLKNWRKNLQRNTAPKGFNNTIKTSMCNGPSSCLRKFHSTKNSARTCRDRGIIPGDSK